MNNNTQHLEKVDLVSDFIDCLNIEKKPKIDDESFEDLEMLEMFETIRALKRLRVDEEFVEDKTKLEDTVPRRIIPIKKFAAAAAIFLLALISAKSLNFPLTSMNKKSDDQMNIMQKPDNRMAQNESAENVAASKLPSPSIDKKPDEKVNTMAAPDNKVAQNQSPKSAVASNPSPSSVDEKPDEQPREQINAMVAPDSGVMKKQNSDSSKALFAEANIVNAMEKAYENITGYSGIIEVRYEDKNGKVDSLETIEIKYKKPDKYIIVQKFEDETVTRMSDGNRLFKIDSDLVTIDYLNPEKETLEFTIAKKIQDLKKASEVKQIGEEVLLGREALVYEFIFSSNEPANKIWIDKITNLPLKQELNMPDGRKLTNQFMQIEVNPNLDDSIFNYEIKEGQKVKYENKESNIDEVN